MWAFSPRSVVCAAERVLWDKISIRRTEQCWQPVSTPLPYPGFLGYQWNTWTVGFLLTFLSKNTTMHILPHGIIFLIGSTRACTFVSASCPLNELPPRRHVCLIYTGCQPTWLTCTSGILNLADVFLNESPTDHILPNRFSTSYAI